MAQDAELKLKVSLDLAFFRQQLSTVGAQLGGQSIPIAIRFDKKSIADQYRLLDRYVRGKKFNVELNLVGGLTKNEFEKIKGRLDDLRSLRKVEIPIGIKNGATGQDVNKTVASIKERIASNQQIKQGGGKLRIETSIRPSVTNEDIANLKKAAKDKLSKIGALEIATKLEVPKVEDLLKGLQKNFNRQKPLLAKTSIKPSILRADVQAFKKAVEEKLSGITIKINAEIGTIGGGKTKAQIEKEALAGWERIQQMGTERMGGVSESARRESLRQSLGGRDIGELKGIGAQLGVEGVGRFRNTQNLIEKIVSEASIEMITKYLDPQAVMRNPDRSGLNKVLDTFARAFFRSFMSEEQIRKEVSQMREAQAPKIQPSLPQVAGLLPSVTQKTSIAQGTESIIQQLIGQQAGGESGVLVDTKRIYAALQKNIEDFLRRAFTVIEVDVTQTTMGIKDAMGAFAYLAQALQDAESRAVKAKIGDAVSSLITKVVGALRSAESQAIIPVKVVDYTGQRSVLPPTSPLTGSPRLALPSAGETTQQGQTRFNAVSGGYNRPAPLEARPFYMAPAFASTTRRIPGSAGRMARGTAKPKMVGQEIPLGPSGGGPEEAAFVKAAQNALKFGLATDIAKKSVDNFRASQLPLIGGLREIGSEFGFAIKQVLLFGTAYKALAFVQSLPGQILNAAKSQQQYNNALQTATQDTGTFAKELLYVDNVQRAFGLNLETTRTGFTRLYASMAPTGFDSGSIEKLFTGISAATAALQLTPDKAERVIYAFGQMASKGQIMSEELKGQLGDVLPGALAIFAKAAGMSVKEFSKAMEDGEFVGSKFRDTFAKVADELMNRFGTGAQAAGKSLQGLLNTVQGDFQRTLESFAPLANAAAQAILGPLGGSLKQLSMSAQIATGEIERTFMQLKQAQQDLGDLRIAADTDGVITKEEAAQIKAAEQNVAALTARYYTLQQAAKDPAIAKQSQDIQLFTQELAKAGTFVMNMAKTIGGMLSPVLNILGTNLTTVISLVTSFYIGFQTARLAAMALMGILLTYRALSTILGFGPATLGANALAGAFNTLGVAATGATVKAVGLTRALQVFAATTIVGAIVGGIMLIAGAFGTMRDRAKEASDQSKNAAENAARAASMGDVMGVTTELNNELAKNRAVSKSLATLDKIYQREKDRMKLGYRPLISVEEMAALKQGADYSNEIAGILSGNQMKAGKFELQAFRGQELERARAQAGQISAEVRKSSTLLKAQQAQALEQQKKIGLNVPTPPSTKPETEAPDEKALKKAQQDAEQAAKQEQQRRIELAGLQNDMDKIGFDYRMGLSDTQFEHEKQLIDELNNYELSGLNDRHARQLKFAQDLKKVQLNAIDAIRKARQKVDEAQLNVVTARRSAQAAGGGGGINSGPIIGGFTPAQLSSATAAASKFTGIANMCSESVKAFYKSLGISLPGVTAWADTVRNAGTTMKDWSKLAPGDIVATGKPGDTPHVGVYTGGQNVFHQSRSRGLRAGNYPDLDYFKQGGYFVRPSAGIKQSSASFSMDTKAQKESFDLIKEQAKASAQTALQQLEIQNALKIAYVQTASTIKANIDSIFPVEKQKLDLSLQQMRHNLLMQGMPQEYIDYEEKRAAATEEAAMAVNVMKDSLSGAKAELKVYNDAVAGGTKLSVDQQANVTRLTGSIAALEEGLANAAKQQREYNIASLESAIATMKQADALKAMEEVSGRINDAVEGVTGTYKSLFKEIAMGGDSVEALKKAQQALADQFLTMVFDMAMKPVEESMKNTLSKMFGVPTEKKKREESIKKMEEQLTQLKLIETNTAITAGKAPASGATPSTAPIPGQTTAAGTTGGFLTGTAALQTLPFNGQTSGMLQTLPFNGESGFLSSIGIDSEALSTSITDSANAYSEQLSKVDTSVFESANALGTAGTELGKEGAAGKKWHESLGQAVGGLGMAAGAVMGIVAGINQIKEGGTSNVLGGIGMIASMAGSLLGSFGGLFGGGAGASSIVQGVDMPVSQMPAGMAFANGGIAFGGFRAFANGGTVSGPTLGLVGEGKYNEAVVPLPDGRSIPVQLGGRSARDIMGNGAPGMPQAPSLSMKFETTKINGVEYVSREQLEQAMAETRKRAARDGATQGSQLALSKIKNSPSTRRQIGV